MKKLIASGRAKKCDFKDRSRPGDGECGGEGHMRKHHILAEKAASGPGLRVNGQQGTRTFRGLDKRNRTAVTLRFTPNGRKPVPKAGSLMRRGGRGQGKGRGRGGGRKGPRRDDKGRKKPSGPRPQRRIQIKRCTFRSVSSDIASTGPVKGQDRAKINNDSAEKKQRQSHDEPKCV